MEDEPFIRGFDHGKGHIKLEFGKTLAIECRPVEIHHKADGAIDNTPSFCIVMRGGSSSVHFYGQFSLNTINRALAEIGYKIERLPDKT